MKDQLPFAVHLTFNGSCRQAFQYYQSCFGGELTMQSLAETPWASEMEDELQKVIVWATLKNKYFKLVGSDLAGDASIVTGNNVSILVQCRSLSERQELIKKLKNKAIQPAIDADPLVNIVDMYRVNWILSIQ